MIDVMIMAGEPSGDAHAAELVKKLSELAADRHFRFFGLTGPKMRAAGVETVVASDDLAIMGLLEIGFALPRFYRVFRQLKQAARERRPDAVILVDYPDFNLPLARALKKQELPIIYYISPQLWAWRSYRVRNIRRDVDLLLAILPFEMDWYARQGVEHVRFVGHPLVGEVAPALAPVEFCRKYGLDRQQPIIALLPGSRHKELTRILPAQLTAAAVMADKNPNLQFVVALAATRSRREVESVKQDLPGKQIKLLKNLIVVQNETLTVLAAAAAAAVASGTATLETALVGTPMVVCYRVAAHNWHTLRHLINVPHYGLINLIAEERLAVELIQNDLTGERLANELEKLLEPETNRKVRERLRQTVDKLGAGGASENAARSIIEFLELIV